MQPNSAYIKCVNPVRVLPTWFTPQKLPESCKEHFHSLMCRLEDIISMSISFSHTGIYNNTTIIN